MRQLLTGILLVLFLFALGYGQDRLVLLEYFTNAG